VFSWRYIDETGHDVGSSDPFEDQEAAEAWLTQEWVSLRDRGIEDVELLDDEQDQALYRMSLEPEAPS
jgi:hypothetical protein